jgi:hypothetical protein
MITLATAWAAPQGIPNSYNALVKDQFLTTACKADDISPPLSNGTTALPDPPYGQKVLHLAVGRGTQVGERQDSMLS